MLRAFFCAIWVARRNPAFRPQFGWIFRDLGIAQGECISWAAQQTVPDTETLTEAKRALDMVAAMPSFQLNVRNQGMNKGLVTLIIVQLLTNIALIATLWYKLG